jgi:hypothetical protein
MQGLGKRKRSWISCDDQKRPGLEVLWYQGMSRVVPDLPQSAPRGLLGGVLYSGNLWVPGVLMQGFEGATPNPTSFLA